MIGSSTLYDGLYTLNLENLYVETLMTLNHNIDTKCSLITIWLCVVKDSGKLNK